LDVHWTAWAKDEPPSPTDSECLQIPSAGRSRATSDSRRSDVPSVRSSSGQPEHMRWWPFTRHRPAQPFDLPAIDPSQPIKRPSLLESSFPSWLPSPHGRHGEGTLSMDQHPGTKSQPHNWGLQFPMPTPPPAPFTLAQSRAPGWEVPWTARPPGSASLTGVYEPLENASGESAEDKRYASKLNRWAQGRKRARTYLLYNAYVPLVCHIRLC